MWLLATVVIAAVVLWLMSDTLIAASASNRQQSFTSQDLLDMAETGATTATVPAAPSISVAVPTSTQQASAATVEPGSTGPAPELIAAPTVASPEAELTGPEARGFEALAMITFPWEELLPGWTIEFLPEADGLYGLTLVSEERIEIYVRENQETALLAHVIAHELGHAVDVTLNSSSDRQRWEDSRGIDSEPWWPTSGATDFSTGAGDFAEAFAAWQVGDQSFRSTLGDAPTAGQEALLAELSVN